MRRHAKHCQQRHGDTSLRSQPICSKYAREVVMSEQHAALLKKARERLVDGIVCSKLSAYFATQRWTVGAYGESIFGIFPRGSVYMEQTAFLLKLSSFLFFATAGSLAVLFLLQ
jgi:hypothetical protein